MPCRDLWRCQLSPFSLALTRRKLLLPPRGQYLSSEFPLEFVFLLLSFAEVRVSLSLSLCGLRAPC